MIDDEVFQVSIARYPKGAVSIVQSIVKMSQGIGRTPYESRISSDKEMRAWGMATSLKSLVL
jgi:hypothetical protein